MGKNNDWAMLVIFAFSKNPRSAVSTIMSMPERQPVFYGSLFLISRIHEPGINSNILKMPETKISA